VAGELLYLDASALVKLVVAEVESGAVQALVDRWPRRVSSRVAAIELARAIMRTPDGARLRARAGDVIAGVALVELNARIAGAAASLELPTLRTLDAIHLASALSLDADVGAFVSYDRRLAQAAEEAGLEVLAPA